jgi:hypothetical protein
VLGRRSAHAFPVWSRQASTIVACFAPVLTRPSPANKTRTVLPGLSRLKDLAARCAQYATKPRLVLFEAHRAIESQVARDRLADLAAVLIRWRSGYLVRSAGGEPIQPNGAAGLRTDGVVKLPRLLNDGQIDEILRWLEPHQCRAQYDLKRGTFLASQVPPDVHLAEYDAESIIQAPYLLSVANDPRILSMVEEFLGAKPTISNLSLWWSFPRVREAYEAQLFHRDVDDLRFCKLFVYLTDVDMDSGPHVFVHGSPGAAACRQIRRYGDEEVKTAFGESAIEYLCGNRGASFVANTGGVHKGLPPLKTKRLLFQVQYSLFPIFASSYSPVPLPPSASALDRYVNRLYVS